MRLLHQNLPIRMNTKKIRRLIKKYGLICPIRQPNPYRRMARELQSNNYARTWLIENLKIMGQEQYY